ncbi:Pentatricopeptide repeat-containing protein [Quillaja saponaria]|uniref:Pentatricopeptide repeat-containing protein n=1 Tax=Quillaja saponaria TaxID=32244 RepID=A0AAD7PG90_QUISA|nr:Pentatricopeptide repeat-containing protein [Quillaja saponaria]
MQECQAYSVEEKFILNSSMGVFPHLFFSKIICELNVYVKCGDLHNGLQLFEELTEKNLVSWSAVIAGFVQNHLRAQHNGKAREALENFGEIRLEGFEPNYITFSCVVYACSKGGFVDEGWMYFQQGDYITMLVHGDIETGKCVVCFKERQKRLRNLSTVI